MVQCALRLSVLSQLVVRAPLPPGVAIAQRKRRQATDYAAFGGVQSFWILGVTRAFKFLHSLVVPPFLPDVGQVEHSEFTIFYAFCFDRIIRVGVPVCVFCGSMASDFV